MGENTSPRQSTYVLLGLELLGIREETCPGCAKETVAPHWEGRAGAEMGVFGVMPWGWVLVGEHWGELQGKGLVAGHITLAEDGSQVDLARRPGAVASSPALNSDSGPVRLCETAHSPTAMVPRRDKGSCGWHGMQSTQDGWQHGCDPAYRSLTR